MAVQATTISDATEDDLPVLAQIITEVHVKEAVMAFIFKDWPATITVLPLMASRISLKFANANTKVIKITDDATGEIFGLTAITLETGEEVADKEIRSNASAKALSPSPGINLEIAAQLRGGRKKFDELMVAKKHYAVSVLAIRLKHQGKGFGTKLMKLCSDIADEAGLPIFLTAFPGAYDMYLKLGYKEINVFEINLNNYGKKDRGFGIYRSYAMLRQPGAL